MTGPIDAAVEAVEAKSAPMPAMRHHVEINTQSGVTAIFEVPPALTAQDVASLFVLLADLVTCRLANQGQQGPPKGVLVTPSGPVVVR